MPRASKISRDRLSEYISSGLCALDISNEVGISVASVRYYMDKYSIEAPKGFLSTPKASHKPAYRGGPPKKVDEQSFRDAIASGLRLQEVMNRFVCSRRTVVLVMKRLDISTPPGFFSTPKHLHKSPGRPMSDERKEQQRKAFSGSGNPFYGGKHSEETKEKLRGPRPKVQGDNNPFKKAINNSPEKRKKASDAAKKRWSGLSAEDRLRRIERMSKAMAESDYHRNFSSVRNYKHGHHISAKAGRVFCRSSWEFQVAAYLDADDRIITYSIESIVIPYVDGDGQKRHTRIDFMVQLSSGHTIILEIKPKGLVVHGRNKRKILAQTEYCREHNIQFCVVTKEWIDKMDEVITKAENGALYV